MPRNARPVLALELIGPAGDILTIRRRFVRTIRTIPGTVAKPGPVNTSEVVSALVFLRETKGDRGGRFRAALFVLAVQTVVISVADPLGSYAIAFSALELRVGVTGYRRAIQLVRVVRAIVVRIANPTLLDALAVRTGEFVRTTSLICKFRFKKKLPKQTSPRRTAGLLIAAVGTVWIIVAHPS